MDIEPKDYEALRDISSRNGLTISDIIGLLMDGYLSRLARENDWECGYVLEKGSPWREKGEDYPERNDHTSIETQNH